MAPLTRRRKKALAASPPTPAINPADRISKLPEEIMAQILSFLPAQEAVRTCVLARTWRHVWKFTRRLLITGKSVEEVREFVDRLLRVRHDGLKLASLDASEIRFDPFVDVEDEEAASLDVEDMCSIKRWIRLVLKCQIQMLRVDISARASFDVYLQVGTRPLLVSQYLTRLELTGVLFICRFLNLDGCPQLEHLEINECCLEDVRKITSLSLKRLVITSCESNCARHRIQICVPRLVSLCLEDMDIRTPLLDRMPELVSANVHIGGSYLDSCHCEDPIACYHVMRAVDTSDIDSDSDDDDEEDSGYAGQNTTKCVVLEGLAQARDLVLMAHSTYILRRDLRWCPTFSNLKALVLILVYLREPADCSVLECMLENAPLLEKLKLILDKVPQHGSDFKVEMKGYLDAKVKSTKISQHLQIVEINCEDVNGIFVNVLNFLRALNICFEIRVTKTY